MSQISNSSSFKPPMQANNVHNITEADRPLYRLDDRHPLTNNLNPCAHGELCIDQRLVDSAYSIANVATNDCEEKEPEGWCKTPGSDKGSLSILRLPNALKSIVEDINLNEDGRNSFSERLKNASKIITGKAVDDTNFDLHLGRKIAQIFKEFENNNRTKLHVINNIHKKKDGLSESLINAQIAKIASVAPALVNKDIARTSFNKFPDDELTISRMANIENNINTKSATNTNFKKINGNNSGGDLTHEALRAIQKSFDHHGLHQGGAQTALNLALQSMSANTLQMN